MLGYETTELDQPTDGKADQQPDHGQDRDLPHGGRSLGRRVCSSGTARELVLDR
jgi:hypothetical protein